MSNRNDQAKHNEHARREFDRYTNPVTLLAIDPPSEAELWGAMETLRLCVAEYSAEDLNDSTFYYSSPKYVQGFDISAIPGNSVDRVLAQLVRDGVLTPHVETVSSGYEYLRFRIDQSKVPPQTYEEAWQRATEYIGPDYPLHSRRLYGLDFNESPLHELKYGAGVFGAETREKVLERLWDEGWHPRPQAKPATRRKPKRKDDDDMAMTTGEATAVNTLLHYFLGHDPKDVTRREIKTDEARNAAGLLAASANKRLMAGLDKKRAEKLFDRMKAAANGNTTAA